MRQRDDRRHRRRRAAGAELASRLRQTGYRPAVTLVILAIYRLSWQFELAFKRLKLLLHIDQLPTRTERGSALLCNDLSQDFLQSSP